MVLTRSLAALAFLVGFAQLPAFALLTDRDVVNAIDRAKVLPASAQMSARVNKEYVQVSTYRNERANDSDTKIEAVLISKSIMEAAAQGEVTRVSVFFYSASGRQCREVSVTAGDVKAFGSGQTGDQELISSLVIKTVETQPDTASISSYLRANRYGWPDRVRRVDMKGEEVFIDAVLDPWITEKDAKLESMKMAERTVEAFPQAKKVVVTYTDPAFKSKQRQVSVNVEQLKEVMAQVATALEPLSLSELKTTGGQAVAAVPTVPTNTGPADIKTYTVVAGALQDERAKILERIRALKDKGVGVGPFFDRFVDIEKRLEKGESVDAAIKDLDEKLIGMEKANKLAKDFVPVAPKGTPAKAPAIADTEGSLDSPAMRIRILQDPQAALQYWRDSFKRKVKQPEDHPNYLKLMDYFAKTLRDAKRDKEAATFEEKAKQIRDKKAADAAEAGAAK